MSYSFSANQYNDAFKSQRLQNWCEPKVKDFKERPTAHEGHTTFIANDRGHLLPGVVKRGSAWPDFKGTWDLPARIQAHHINPTARSSKGLERLKSWGLDPQHTGKSQPQRGSKNTDKDDGKKTNGGTAASSAAKLAPPPQSHSTTDGETSARQKQEPEAASESAALTAEEKQASRASGKDRLPSECREEQLAVRPAADEGPKAANTAQSSSK